MKRRGDLISEVNTKSGAPVTKWTSCPARIRFLATWAIASDSF
uniref:Galactokinase n=1 Tax=Rhizophora mucronata TaxID=61149 RepID=A0A2P2MS43_RHIMU